MSHRNQQLFVAHVKSLFPEMFLGRRVIEVGSLNINGTVRGHFSECEYIGVDIGPGPGVDIVSYAHDLKYPDGSFDVAVSCEAFEHDRFWSKTFATMCRLSRSLVVFTCASTGRMEHGTEDHHPETSPYTNNYYKNLCEHDFDSDYIRTTFSSYQFMNVPPQVYGASETKKRWCLLHGACDRYVQGEDLYFWGVKRLDL